MEEVTKVTKDAVDRYFTVLSQYGYFSYGEVKKLLLLVFLEEVLSGDYNILLKEEEFKDIIKATYCLFGNSCMIDYPEFFVEDNMSAYQRYLIRIIEDNNVRLTENDELRLEA